MRLFTAIELTNDARAAIAAEQKGVAQRLGDRARSLRFVRPEHQHLTLVFVGEVVPDAAPALVASFGADIRLAPFHLVLGGLGVFPDRGAPRVLWLGVMEGARQVVALHAEVAARLSEAGVGVERKPFHPHLTLARWRDSRGARRPMLPAAGPVTALDATEVALFESRLSPAGPSYTRLARARLACP